MKFLFVSFLFVCSMAQADYGFVDSPEQCFVKHRYPCSLRVSQGFLSFERESQKYHLAEKSSLLFVSPSQVQLLQGRVWVQDSKSLRIKISSALQMTISGEWFFEKQMDSTLLARNLSGEALFNSKFVFAHESLPLGFQNWFGPVDSTGQISRGVIRPIAVADFLRAWLPLTGLSVAESKKRSQNYKSLWAGNVEQSATLYKQVVQRRLASQQEKAQKKADQRAKRLAEQAELKKMFRQKNGL